MRDELSKENEAYVQEQVARMTAEPAFVPVEDAIVDKDGVRIITEMQIHEISLMTDPNWKPPFPGGQIFPKEDQ